MFKTQHASVREQNKAQDAWGVDVNFRLFVLGATKRQLARHLDVNYSQLCNVISGTVYNATLRNRISEALCELENAAK